VLGSADQDDLQVKGMVSQVGCAAVTWLHAHAAELGVAPGRLAAGLGLLARDTRLHAVPRKQSLWVSFLVGLGFAAGWSPCIGPILSLIILQAAQEKLLQATVLLFVYSLGLAIPFLIVAAFITQSLGALGRLKRFLPVIEATSGAILVATGLVVATDQFTRIAGFFYQYVKAPSL